MRRNRFDIDDPDHVAVVATPERYTRVSRRAAGLRWGVHVDEMRTVNARQTIIPRAVRRLMRDPLKAEVRLRRKRAKVNRLLAPYGATL